MNRTVSTLPHRIGLAAGLACLLLWRADAAAATNLYVNANGTNPVPPYTSWAVAATAIEAAVSFAAAGDTILVSNGTYKVAVQITITNGIVVRSVNGSGKTTIQQANTNGNGRVLSVQNPNAVVDGFAIQSGHANTDGGGVLLTAGVLSNCLLTLNSANLRGGGVYCDTGGRVANCTFTANSAIVAGGGLWVGGGVAEHCEVFLNTAQGSGAGVGCAAGGTLRNSLIYQNTSGVVGGGLGGGVYCMDTGTVESCTIADNSAGLDGGGMYFGGSNGVVRNTIVYWNKADRYGANYASDKTPWQFGWSCADPLPAGTNNTAADPEFKDRASAVVSDYRLLPGSPCIEGGTNQTWMSGALDMSNGARILGTNVEMGAYEFDTRPFTCNFTADKHSGTVPLTVVFTSIRSGTNTAVKAKPSVPRPVDWGFNNDQTLLSVHVKGWAESFVVTNTFTVPGTYSVSLAIDNTSGETATAGKSDYIQVGGMNAYVSPRGGNVFPYTNWAIAATSIQVAVDAVIGGGTVSVTDGTYFVSAPISIADAVTVRSINGAENTIVDGSAGTKCFSLDHVSAVLEGFTAQNGAADQGAGIYANAGQVRNCAVRDNIASTFGGGLFCGAQASAVNCLVFGNTALLSGGGVWNQGSLVNCTVADNQAPIRGGGVFNDTPASSLTNTIIYGNSSANGPDYYGTGTFSYCCASPVPAGVSNFAANPLFVYSAIGDYRLATNSPCRDAGTNQDWMTNTVDLAGYARQVNGTVDIGAYEWNTTPLLLVYQSQPPSGLIRFRYGTNQTWTVTTPILSGTTQYLGAGWALTGSVSSNGVGTNATVSLTNDAVLTWRWTTQYWFQAASSNLAWGGVSGDTNGWYNRDTILHVAAVASNYYHFTNWLGAAGGANLTLTNTRSWQILACFAPTLTTNGTPLWWLGSYGLTNPSPEAADIADSDGDGMASWGEYRAGTDPTNGASVLAVRFFTPSATGAVVRWSSVTGKTYSIDRSTNLLTGFVAGLATNLVAVPPTNTYTDATATGQVMYLYRVGVE